MFRAYEPERDRLVAVKVFRLDLPPERVHQLVGEFERLIESGLRHPGITTPVATGINGVVAYLAQDYISADSLDIVMRENGPLPLVDALRVARQLAEGLDFAADRHVEHGALHPRDVLLSPEGAWSVGVGVTRALEHIGAATPIRRPYSAPERLAGEAWDRRADVFSLAAIVYEMLWGRRLVGTGMQAVETMTPLPGTHLTALQAVFAGALAEQAVDRFETATEFIESLERAASPDVATAEPVYLDTEPLASSPAERFRVAEQRRAEPTEPLLLPLEDDVPRDDVDDVDRVPRFSSLEPVEPPREPLEPLEPVEPLEPLVRLEPLAPVEPLEPLGSLEPRKSFEPPFLGSSSTPSFSAAPDSSSPLVWPIGLACVVGLAIGFGVGYTVGSRDRARVNQAASAPAAPATPAAPTERGFTENSVETRPPAEVKPPVERRLPPEEGAPVVPFSGRVVVRSTPPGARVFVDGRDRGATPATVTNLARGEHRVRIVYEGYTAAERRVVLSPARPSQALTVPLAKVPVAPKPGATKADPAPNRAPSPEPRAETGSLLIDSRPTGATVLVDGRIVGKTPLTLPDVKTGDHAVRLELAGHRPWAGSIKVEGGTSNRVGGSLEKID